MVIRTGEYNVGDLAVYVPIDSMVPIRDERFAFLAKQHTPDEQGRCRVRAARLRGVFSMGLLVQVDTCPNCHGQDLTDFVDDPCAQCGGTGSAWHESQEVSTLLGIELYEAPEPTDPDAEKNPGFLPHYNIESARKWHRTVLTLGEEVILDEKINGETGRFAYYRDRLWCASAQNFKRADTTNPWRAVAQALDLERRLALMPGFGFYGEVYGTVSGMKYGANSGQPKFSLFDILDIETRRWLDRDEVKVIADRLDLPMVPRVFRGPWSPEIAFKHAEGTSVLADQQGAQHVREGWVLRPARERTHPELGRVILKLHGQSYLLRKTK